MKQSRALKSAVYLNDCVLGPMCAIWTYATTRSHPAALVWVFHSFLWPTIECVSVFVCGCSVSEAACCSLFTTVPKQKLESLVSDQPMTSTLPTSGHTLSPLFSLERRFSNRHTKRPQMWFISTTNVLQYGTKFQENWAEYNQFAPTRYIYGLIAVCSTDHSPSTQTDR